MSNGAVIHGDPTNRHDGTVWPTWPDALTALAGEAGLEACSTAGEEGVS